MFFLLVKLSPLSVLKCFFFFFFSPESLWWESTLHQGETHLKFPLITNKNGCSTTYSMSNLNHVFYVPFFVCFLGKRGL